MAQACYPDLPLARCGSHIAHDPSGLAPKFAQVNVSATGGDEFDLLNLFFTAVGAQFTGEWTTEIVTTSFTLGDTTYTDTAITDVFTSSDFSTTSDWFSTFFGSSPAGSATSGTGGGDQQNNVAGGNHGKTQPPKDGQMVCDTKGCRIWHADTQTWEKQLTTTQCNQMNQGFFWLDTGTFAFGYVVGGFWGGAGGFLLTAIPQYYFNNKLCGGPGFF